MRFAPGGRASPGTVGILTASAATAVPRAIDGTRLDCGAVSVLTHSSSATKSARNAGVALCGLTHGFKFARDSPLVLAERLLVAAQIHSARHRAGKLY